MKLNEKIVFLRKEKNMSQVDLADALGISRQTVSKWENGDSLPDVTNLQALAALFEVSTDELLNDEKTVSRKNYPEWLDRLPGFMSSMVHKYGWLYGVETMVSGAIFTVMGLLSRFMFRTMMFGSDDSYEFYMMFGQNEFPGWTVAKTFTGFFIGIGVVLLVAGAVLAVVLKKYGMEKEKKS